MSSAGGIERARVEVVLRRMPTGLVMVDATGPRVLFCNDSARALAGDDTGDAAAEPAWDPPAFTLDGSPLGGAAGFARARLADAGEWRGELLVERPDGGRVRMWVVVTPVHDDAGAVVAGIVQFLDVTSTRRSELLLHLLDRVGEALSGLDDLDTALAEALDAIVPGFCDDAFLLLLDGDQRLVVYNSDGGRRPRPLGLLHPTVWQRLRAGETLFGAAADDRMARTVQHDETLRARVASSVGSAVTCPLHARGRFHGAIVFTMRTDRRRFDPGDVAVAAQLADRIATGVEQRRLHQAVVGHVQRARRLQQLAERLAAANSTAEMVDAVLAATPATLGATRVGLALFAPGDTAGTRHGDLVLAALAARAGRVLATRAGAEGLVPFAPGAGTAIVPFRLGPRLVGVLAADRTDEGLPADVGDSMAQLGAHAFERARLVDGQRSVAATLQQALLPHSLPRLHGIQVTSAYRPGGRDVDVGGDWYDAFALPKGRVGLIIGDVAGRGAAAAAVMGHVRTTMSVLAADGDDPATVLERTDRHLQATYGPGQMVTCCYLVLDAGEGTLTYANAGHPPPMLVSAFGVETVDALLGPPLGLAPDIARRSRTRVVPDAATLVLYTDGLVERRGETIDVGISRLQKQLHRLTTQRLTADDVLGLVPANVEDDVAVLVVGIDVPHPLHLDVPASPGTLRGVRVAVNEWLERLGASPVERFDLVTAVNEAAANAAMHAYVDRAGQRYTVDAGFHGGVVRIVVRDAGEWRERRGAHDGRGLDLMARLSDRAVVDRGLFGTTVVLERRLAFASSEG